MREIELFIWLGIVKSTGWLGCLGGRFVGMIGIAEEVIHAQAALETKSIWSTMSAQWNSIAYNWTLRDTSPIDSARKSN
jgi:hypothetical protein